MKKLFKFTIFILLAAALFHFSGQISRKSEEVLESVGNIPALENIKQEISTPGGLRGKLDEKSAQLTRLGTIEHTNREREKNGLPRLKENSLLNQAAAAKARDMFKRQYFEHVSPQGVGPADLVEQAGYLYVTVGENLALGNYKNDAALVEAWMNSPGHKANILSSKFTEIGVAVLKGQFEGKTTWLAVQTFARPISQCPKVDSELKVKMDSLRAELSVLEPELQRVRSELENWEPNNQTEFDAYNTQVENYNNLVKNYNNKLDLLKGTIAEYNTQVNAFNQCLGE
jgi:uncharacterized protein YkwD